MSSGANARSVPRTSSASPAAGAPAARPELRLVAAGRPGNRPAGAPGVRRPSSATEPRSRRAPFVLLLVALLVGTTLALLVLNTAIAVDSLKASNLRAQNAELAQEVQRLQQQVVARGTPAELAAAAIAAGLVPAGAAGYLVLDADGGATLRGTPEPAPAPQPRPESEARSESEPRPATEPRAENEPPVGTEPPPTVPGDQAAPAAGPAARD